MKIKGFDKNLQCRGFQFEVGKTYNTGKKKLELCTDSVFHYCDSIEKVHMFYDVLHNNRFCEIKVLGKEVTDGRKCGSNKIKIVREIVGKELCALKRLNNGNTGLFNSGNGNTGNWNTGNSNTGNWNTGNKNTGDENSGNRNSGNWNSGYWNSGYSNSGNSNSGDCNSGNSNSGDWNSGDFNSCNYSSGLFCNQPQKVKIFNVDTEYTHKEFYDSVWWQALTSCSFSLTYMDNDELKTRTYKEACAAWWEGMTDENKEIIKTIPNFSWEVFTNITGIAEHEV